MGKFDHIVDMILEDDESNKIEDAILLESEEEDIIQTLGDVTKMNYLLKLEEYFDDHDLYLFDGWEDAQILAPVKIERFWTTFFLLVSPKTDLRGITRIQNDKEGQNKVAYKDLGDDKGYIIRVTILKRYLDAIEKKNKLRAQELSDDELAKV